MCIRDSYYLDDRLTFPFQAKCSATRVTSPLETGETVEVLEMAPEDACDHEMLVMIRWQSRTLAVPLSHLTPLTGGEAVEEAAGDWRYWVERGYEF